MEYNKSQSNQSAPVQSPAGQRFASPTGGSRNGRSHGKRLAVFAAFLLVTLALVIGALYVALQDKKDESANSRIEKDKYQAVFMTNGQVYFGNLDKLDASYSELTDVYYLQVQQDVQPAAEQSSADKSQVSLTKLGNELHGPTDRMHISRDQILFWENLKDDSTVTKAIKEYESKQ